MVKSLKNIVLSVFLISFLLFSLSACSNQNGVKSLEIEVRQIAKLNYYVGEYFSLQGIKVYAKLKNGKVQIIDFANQNNSNENGYTYNKYKIPLTSLDKKIVFSFKGKTASIDIEVTKYITQAPKESDISYHITSHSITILSLQNAEYKIGDSDWQDGNTFGGLLAGQEYVIKVRYKETDSTFASNELTLKVTTNKGIQEAVAESDFVISKSGTTITIQEISGCEYRINNSEWTENNIFENLTLGQNYDVQIRKKATKRLNPSATTTKTIAL